MSDTANLTIKLEDEPVLVSMEKIKPSFVLPPPSKPRLPSRVRDDDVLFVKAERIVRPVINALALEAFGKPTFEPTNDPLEVNRSFPCSHCKKVFSSAQYLITHVEKHTNPRKRKKLPPKPVQVPSSGPTAYVCPYCNLTFEKEKSLAGHLHVHKGRVSENAMKCKDCDMMFNSKGSLWNHKKKAHTKVLHKCKVCMETFITKPAFEKHLKRHELEGVKMCDICGKSEFLAKYFFFR